MVVNTLQRKNYLFKHTQLGSAVLTCLIAKVDVVIVIHKADPLQKWVKSDMHANATKAFASTAVVWRVKLPMLKSRNFATTSASFAFLTWIFFYNWIKSQICLPVDLDWLWFACLFGSLRWRALIAWRWSVTCVPISAAPSPDKNIMEEEDDEPNDWKECYFDHEDDLLLQQKPADEKKVLCGQDKGHDFGVPNAEEDE